MVTFIVRYRVAVYFILVFRARKSYAYYWCTPRVSHFRSFRMLSRYFSFLQHLLCTGHFLCSYQIGHVVGFHKQLQCDIRQLYLFMARVKAVKLVIDPETYSTPSFRLAAVGSLRDMTRTCFAFLANRSSTITPPVKPVPPMTRNECFSTARAGFCCRMPCRYSRYAGDWAAGAFGTVGIAAKRYAAIGRTINRATLLLYKTLMLICWKVLATM